MRVDGCHYNPLCSSYPLQTSLWLWHSLWSSIGVARWHGFILSETKPRFQRLAQWDLFIRIIFFLSGWLLFIVYLISSMHQSTSSPCPPLTVLFSDIMWHHVLSFRMLPAALKLWTGDIFITSSLLKPPKYWHPPVAHFKPFLCFSLSFSQPWPSKGIIHSDDSLLNTCFLSRSHTHTGWK